MKKKKYTSFGDRSDYTDYRNCLIYILGTEKASLVL